MADAKLLDSSGNPATHDENGIKVTMPYLVQLTARFMVEARDRQQAATAIQRATSFSAGIAPYLIDLEMGADLAAPELIAKIAGVRNDSRE